MFITSKLSPADHGYQQAREAFFESLDDLGLDYLDLYLIHWPAAQGVPMTSEQNAVKRRESWRALESLYKEGKVRAIGVSNYTVQHLEQLREYAEITPHVNQVEFHPQCQQKELVAYCEKHNIKLVSYSPLGQGRVRPISLSLAFGNFFQISSFVFPNVSFQLLDHEDIMKIARRRNLSPAALLLRWGLRKNMRTSHSSLTMILSLFASIFSLSLSCFHRLPCANLICASDLFSSQHWWSKLSRPTGSSRI